MRGLDYMIATMQAAKEGKKIENRPKDSEAWIEAYPVWDWNRYDYRVKPEPEIIKLSERGMHAELVRGEQWKVGLGDPHYLYLSPFEIDNLYQASRKARGIKKSLKCPDWNDHQVEIDRLWKEYAIPNGLHRPGENFPNFSQGYSLGYKACWEAHIAALEKQS